MIRIVSACPQGVFQWQGRRIIVVMIRVFVAMLMTIVMAMAASPRQQRAGVFVVRQMQRHDERLHDQANRHQHSEKLRERRVACSRESHSGWRSLGASSFRRLTTLRLSRVAIQGGVGRAARIGAAPCGTLRAIPELARSGVDRSSGTAIFAAAPEAATEGEGHALWPSRR